MHAQRHLQLEKLGLWLLLLVPLAYLGVAAATANLGANPVETLTHATGLWSLRILLLSLLPTPIHRLTGWRHALRHRRLLGLFALFYAMLHFAIYLVFDQELDFRDTMLDIGKRPYITVGFSALLLLLPLGLTSTHAMVKRMGIKRWQRLHRLVYVAAILVIVHFLWLVKKDITSPTAYGLALFLLLAIRVVLRKRTAA